MTSTSSRQSSRSSDGARFWRRIIVIALGLAALSTYVGLGLFVLKQSHDRELEFAHHSQENFAKVLEEHARSSIEKIDTVLLASQLRLNEAFAGESMDVASINAALAKYLGLISESQSLRVADKNGRFIFDSSGSISTATIADRDYFLRNKANSRASLVISEPLFARITNNWVITLSRRINGPQGEFAGLVQAAVGADFFQNFY
ncbi:MAG: PAS domain S-box/diguanylate cyclase (GGDEF) domain-containing protein, partial [Comamonadaceae bacterium]